MTASETLALGARGSRLWAALLAQDPTLENELNPMREVGLSACRTADRVEMLERLAATTDAIVDGRTGPTVHPAMVEVRQQSALLSRLVAAMRLPDEVTGAKPQRRQVRGVQRPTAVTSMDRFRAAGV